MLAENGVLSEYLFKINFDINIWISNLEKIGNTED
jgi:hypothetical protein